MIKMKDITDDKFRDRDKGYKENIKLIVKRYERKRKDQLIIIVWKFDSKIERISLLLQPYFC